jgi:excisionase family DNA binding protein
MFVKEFTLADLSEDEKIELEEMEGVLHGEGLNGASHPPMLVVPSGQAVRIPMQIFQAFEQLLDHMVKGRAFSIIPSGYLLDIDEATEYLGAASRSFVPQLLESGQLPFVEVGTRKLIRFADLLAYKERTHQERLEFLAEMLEFSQETDTL